MWSTHDGGATWHQVGGVVGADQTVADLETGGGSVYLVTAACLSTSGDAQCSPTSEVDAAATASDDFSRLTTVSNSGSDPRLAVHGTDWWVSVKGALSHGSGRHGPSPLATVCAADELPGLITAIDSSHLDGLCRGQGAGGSARAQLRGSTDGGRTWTDAGVPFTAPTGLQQIADNGAGVLFFAGASGNSILSRTTDDGGSFSIVVRTDAGGGTDWTDAGFTTSSQAFAVLPGQFMYLSTDVGASWQKVTFGG